jgi:(R,R)-butanediol dehydrogenase/meso-butanediol dehydrogenase/diacetyl reductase
MRVAVFHGAGKPITIERAPIPEPATSEVLIKVSRCGICGTDISMTSGGAFSYPVGCRLGHEYAGEVVDTGRAVTSLKVGDHVTCLAMAGCGRCEACRQGRQFHCSSARPLFGGFGDYLAAPEAATFRLPQGLSMADGALVEPIACGRHALKLANFQPGERILVLGAGSIAMAIVFWARRRGAGEIIVSSRSAHRRETALAMGADLFHSADEDDPETLERALVRAPDVVAECIGQPGMIGKAVNHVRMGGAVVSMGMCMHAEPFLGAQCTFKDARVVFPLAYSAEDFTETIKAFEADDADPSLMVSEIIALEEVPAAFERIRAGGKSLKVQVDLNRSVDT